MPVEKSAGAIMFKKEESRILFLVLKHRAGHWSFPKGLIEENETPEETAIREIKEETNLKNFNFIDNFKEYHKFFFKVKYDYQFKKGFKKGENVMKVVTYFLAEAKDDEIKLSHEHDDYKWLACPDILEKITYKNDKEILKKAYDFLS